MFAIAGMPATVDMPATAVTHDVSNGGGTNNIEHSSKNNDTTAAGLPATIETPSAAGTHEGSLQQPR